MTHGRADIHELLVTHDLRPSRALGQNFVADANTVRRIVRLAGVEKGTPVVEVGAGLGSLTIALAEAGASVTAVEVDRHVLPVLREQVEPLGVRVVEADALDVDWNGLLGTEPGPWSLVANLPYNVAVPLVVRVLEEAPSIESLLVMVQREVGERIAAGVGDKAYGAVSVKVAYWATANVVGRVSPSVFIPRPHVDSALVRLDRHDGYGKPPDSDTPSDGAAATDGGASVAGARPGPGSPAYDRLFTVVRAGFAHRRKMLRRALDGVVDPEAYDATGIPATAHAEELGLEAWERLARWTGSTESPPRPGPRP